MRILQVHNRYQLPGGEDRVVSEEARLLRDSGHQVEQWIVRNPSGMKAGMDLARSAWNSTAAKTARELENRTMPDVVHVHNTWFALSAAPVKAFQSPVVMTLHNYRLTCSNAILFRDGKPCRLCVDGSAWNGVRYGCYRGKLASIPAAANVAWHRRVGTWVESVDLFLALNSFARDVFIQTGLPAERVIIKPHFVEDPGPRSDSPATSDRVLFVGRLEAAKGVDILAAAWRRARPHLRLVVVGDGPCRGSFGDLPNVEFLGQQPMSVVTSLMKTSRALVVPSLAQETHPLTVLEALAAGLPTMASDHIGLRNTVEELPGEWLVPAGWIDGWSKALIRLEDASVVDIAAAKARSLYEGAFTPGHGIKALEDAYHRVARHGI